jgi:hypothetical protein
VGQTGPWWAGGPCDAPFSVTLDGAELEVPELPTGWWLGVLAEGDWTAVLGHLDPGVIRRLLDPADDLDTDDVHRLGARIAETICGMPWPTAVRLSAAVTRDWHTFEAWCAANTSVEPLTSPPRRVLGAAYAMATSTAKDEAELQRIKADLANPAQTNAPTQRARRMKGLPVPSWGAEEEAAAFREAFGENVTSIETRR